MIDKCIENNLLINIDYKQLQSSLNDIRKNLNNHSNDKINLKDVCILTSCLRKVMINNNIESKDKFIIVSMGSRGLIYCRYNSRMNSNNRIIYTDKDLNISDNINIYCEYYSAIRVPINDIVDSNGKEILNIFFIYLVLIYLFLYLSNYERCR